MSATNSRAELEGRLEDRIRASLADLRPGDAAPERLRARIEQLPERFGRPGIVGRIVAMRRSLVALAVVAAVATVAALAVSLTPLRPLTPGGNAPNPTFDPSVEGPGLLHDPIPTMLIVQVVSIVAALVFVVGWTSARAFRSRRGIAAGLVAVGLAGGSILLAVQALTVTGGFGPALGYDASASPPPGSDGPRVYYSTAEPGQPTIAFFEVWNFGALPIQLDGMVVDDIFSGAIGPRFTALALATVPNEYPNSLDKLQPFTAQLIPPQSSVVIYLVGRAGACAFGPGYAPDVSEAPGFSVLTRDVRLGYSVFGLASTTVVEMPMQLVEPAAVRCP